EIDAGIAGRGCGFARERVLTHLAVARAVVDFEDGLGIDVANDVLAFAVHAAERDLAAGHDRHFVPAETPGPRDTPFAAHLHLTAPVAFADHERPERRIALLDEGKERAVALAAVGHSRNRHGVRKLAPAYHVL